EGGGRDFLRRARAPERQVAEELGEALGVAVERLGALAIERRHALGGDRPGVDADYADAVGVGSAAERAGKGHETGVGRASGDVGSVELLAGGADDVDDDAAAPRLHPCVDEARQVHISEYLEVPGAPPRGFVDAEQGAARYRARVVHENVELARPFGER